MLKSKTINRVCIVTTAVTVVIALLLWGIVEPIRGDGSHEIGYEKLLFDNTVVHTIEISMDGWDEFIANATAEEYTDCDITVDGEKFSHVAIRAKGNTSLSSVATLGSVKYSFKVEFDHYVKGMTYHGLDKLSLNNMIQDSTLMKDYLAYTLMDRMDVPAPKCSYVQIFVNGELWGLYLAVEGVEDAFMDRNGMTKGELYKPDSMSFGGGRGNGRDFDIEQFREKEDTEESTGNAGSEAAASPETAAAPDASAQADGTGESFGGSAGAPADGFGQSDGNSAQPDTAQGTMPDISSMPSGDFAPSDGSSASEAGGTGTDAGQAAAGQNPPSGFGGGPGEGGFSFGGFNFGMGSDDVRLIYSDDDPDSYSNIFNNAKTNVTKKDKKRLIESIRKLNAREDLDDVVDKDEVISYLAVHNFLCNDDSYTGMMVHNYYLYEENGKLSILPWDYNLAFGGFAASADATSTVNSSIDSPVTGGTTGSRPLIAWIFDDEDALARYHETYSRFIAENIESGWLAEEISRVQAMIAPYLENDDSSLSATNEFIKTMDEFNKAVETLQVFCAKRGESIRGQLNGSAEIVDTSEISTADMGSMNTGSTPGEGGGFSMPAGMPDMGSFDAGSIPEGFSIPEGATMPQGMTMPEGAGGDGDGASFGGSTGTGAADAGATAAPQAPAETAAPENAASAAAETAVPETSEQPADGDRTGSPEGDPGGKRPQEMPGGFSIPGGMDFSGGQAGNSIPWGWLGGLTALLVAAILIIRKVRPHN